MTDEIKTDAPEVVATLEETSAEEVAVEEEVAAEAEVEEEKKD